MIKRSGIMVKLRRVKTLRKCLNFQKGFFFSFFSFLFLINVISDVCFLYKQILLSEEK